MSNHRGDIALKTPRVPGATPGQLADGTTSPGRLSSPIVVLSSSSTRRSTSTLSAFAPPHEAEEHLARRGLRIVRSGVVLPHSPEDLGLRQPAARAGEVGMGRLAVDALGAGEAVGRHRREQRDRREVVRVVEEVLLEDAAAHRPAGRVDPPAAGEAEGSRAGRGGRRIMSRSPLVASTGSASVSPKLRRSGAMTRTSSGSASATYFQKAPVEMLPWTRSTGVPSVAPRDQTFIVRRGVRIVSEWKVFIPSVEHRGGGPESDCERGDWRSAVAVAPTVGRVRESRGCGRAAPTPRAPRAGRGARGRPVRAGSAGPPTR